MKLDYLFATDLLFVLMSGRAEAKTANERKTPSCTTDYARALIGTTCRGRLLAAATLPFGLVQMSPDIHSEKWDWAFDYHSVDSDELREEKAKGELTNTKSTEKTIIPRPLSSQ